MLRLFIGWELLEDRKAVGFERVEALVDWSAEFGHLGGEQVVFKATKGRGSDSPDWADGSGRREAGSVR